MINPGITFKNVGAFTDYEAIPVDSASAVSLLILSTKSFVYIVNTGDNIIWFGGSSVDGDTKRGTPLYPAQGFVIESAKNDFSTYFICEDTKTSTISYIMG